MGFSFLAGQAEKHPLEAVWNCSEQLFSASRFGFRIFSKRFTERFEENREERSHIFLKFIHYLNRIVYIHLRIMCKFADFDGAAVSTSSLKKTHSLFRAQPDLITFYKVQ